MDDKLRFRSNKYKQAHRTTSVWQYGGFNTKSKICASFEVQ